jgi:hypothetical protein
MGLKGTVSREGFDFWRCICYFPPALTYNLHSPPANGKQGPIPEEMSQTLLTNKKQGNMD